MSEDDFRAAGASAARNKLAGFLRERGLKIAPDYPPPEDDDFWYAIQEFAERYGAALPHFGEESVASRNFRESLESYRTQQESRATEQAQKPAKQIQCKHCGLLFAPERGKRMRYVNECPDCLREITYPGPRTGGVATPLSEKTIEKIDQAIANSVTQDRRKPSLVSFAMARVLEKFARQRQKP